MEERKEESYGLLLCCFLIGLVAIAIARYDAIEVRNRVTLMWETPEPSLSAPTEPPCVVRAPTASPATVHEGGDAHPSDVPTLPPTYPPGYVARFETNG